MVNSHPAFGVSGVRKSVRHFACSALLLFACLPVAHAQSVTAAGTVIRNSARVEYLDTNANPASVQSNDVALNVAPPPSLSTINLLRASAATGEAMNAGPTQCRGNNGIVTLPAPTMSGGASIDISQPVALARDDESSRRRAGVRAARGCRSQSRRDHRSTRSKYSSRPQRTIAKRCACQRRARTPACSSATYKRAPTTRTSATACSKSSAMPRSRRRMSILKMPRTRAARTCSSIRTV